MPKYRIKILDTTLSKQLDSILSDIDKRLSELEKKVI